VPIRTSGRTSPPGSKTTPKTTYNWLKLTPQEHTPKPSASKATDDEDKEDKPRKPAAKLESYAGRGASLESFLAKFESHAKYFRWSEQDRVVQLQNILTGTAAQTLWTGGEHASSEELIKLFQSHHGSKQQTERFW